jgi:nucleotide-binding universal stress UspA family protein
MALRPSVLCPVDFSDASRGALRYAAALSDHFQARLTVLTVDDPLLADAAETLHGDRWLTMQSQQDLEGFVKDTFSHHHPVLPELQLIVLSGKPAPQIARVAAEQQADLIVMSSHGTTGARKLLFGSTTERVLRETSTPVLITPAADPGPASLADVKDSIRRVLVPVDLSPATPLQVRVARGLAEALDASMLLIHVLERPNVRPAQHALAQQLSDDRSRRSQTALAELIATIPPRLRPQAVCSWGNPADEIARVAREERAGVVVMGLHATAANGPRMGSITYRVLCQIPALVLALPPGIDRMASRRLAVARAEAGARV